MKKFPVLGLFVFVFVLLSASALSLLHPSQQAFAGCGGPFPPKPAKVWTKSGPGGGEITLYWDEVAYANRYAVAYGQWSGKYTYGADNIGGTQSRSYTVKGLTPGGKYVFALAAARDCASSPFSHEVWGTAGWGSATQVSTPSTPVAVASPAKASLADEASAKSAAKGGPVGKQSLWAKSGPGVGQVTLYWKQADSANNYHLVYGTQPGRQQYGALNIGNTTWYTVKHLAPGTRYYFALVPLFNGRSLPTTAWVSAVSYTPPVVEVVEVSTPPVYVQPTIPQPTVTPYEPQTMAPDDGEEEVVYEPNSDDVYVQGASDEKIDDEAYENAPVEKVYVVPETDANGVTSRVGSPQEY